MSKTRAFLRKEDGAISVDWVVLTAIATATAMGTVGVLSTGVKTANHEVEVQMGLIGSVSDTWGAAMRDYIPYDEDTHTALHTGLTSLSSIDLGTMSGYLLTYVADETMNAQNADDHGALNDISFATGLANSDRGEARPTSEAVDMDDVARIAADLGWTTIPGTDHALPVASDPAAASQSTTPEPEPTEGATVTATVDGPVDDPTTSGGSSFFTWLAEAWAYIQNKYA